MSFFDQGFNNIFRSSHIVIIAVLFSFILTNCGYKTPPVYVPPQEQNTTLDSNGTNCTSSCNKNGA